MTTKELDAFQDWLQKQADAACWLRGVKNNPYFSGRACAFRDAFEYLAILRMTNSVESPNAHASPTQNTEDSHEI